MGGKRQYPGIRTGSDSTMDEFLRRQIESYVSEHKHANAVAHIIREPKSPAALEAIAKIQKGRGR